ncbi:hypothetical protein AVEN_221931-1 [Araneus ventricosus]|uniref:Uncharacterized protein n=1 Tax=Araneus ventricosus TaxID=182803 RepID=A0A4Y2F705_ARAVE|nr:hypothetical protein AVEN_221931-1 [Araneus ventricosus]
MVKTEAESGHSVVVVGTDSDLLILIVALMQSQGAIYMLVSGILTTARKLKTGAGLSNSDSLSLSHPLYTRRQTTCCISFAVGAKDTAPGIVRPSEVGSCAPLSAAHVQESPTSIGIFRIPRMNAIPRSLSKPNVPVPQPDRIAEKEDNFNERYWTLPIYLCM